MSGLPIRAVGSALVAAVLIATSPLSAATPPREAESSERSKE